MSVDDSPVRLVIPAHARFLRLARLTAAGIAGDSGFGLEAIEDLRVAVDEVCAILIEGAADGTELELVYRATADGLVDRGLVREPRGRARAAPRGQGAVGHDRRRLLRVRRPATS